MSFYRGTHLKTACVSDFRLQLVILTPSSLPLLCLYMFVDVQGRLMKQLSNTLKRMWKLTYKTFTQKLDQCAHVE
uniref:Uncharacterized protein n=1 Tax=Anguilla anguilla TaxID=7936 RepID=A0A0E9XY45_ANGAN